jgi:hypothetical protein
MALGRSAVLRWINGIVKEMKLKRLERFFALSDVSVKAVLLRGS